MKGKSVGKIIGAGIFLLLLLSFAGGFWFLRSSIPDRIQIVQGTEQEDWSFHLPLVEEASNSGTSNIPTGEVKITCSFLGIIPMKEIQVELVEEQYVIPGGDTIGIYMETNGVLVIGTGEVVNLDGVTCEPAENIVRSGDAILAVDGTSVETKEELMACIGESGGKELVLEVLRNGSTTSLKVQPVQTGAGEYKLGIWVRDDAQGIGTLTYVDSEKNFGALGHGISDVDTGMLLDVAKGALYNARILSINKGVKGAPGELTGIICYQEEEKLGELEENTELGIFGTVTAEAVYENRQPLAVGYKQEVQEGAATFLCSLDGEVEEFEIAIEKIYLNSQEANKSMVLHVTDETLLARTGGIVQGMSGSPILQNGKIIGAITHVFIQDPTRGYGIFIESML